MSESQSPSPLRRRGSLVKTMRAVAWSFFGVRRSADYEHDVQELNPVHVVIVAIVGALLFIAALVLLARWVVASGVVS